MNKSEVDFPAAHSMDATWFAMDSEGNIGVFQTGEAGAAPAAGLSKLNMYSTELLLSLLDKAGYAPNFDDLLIEPDGKIYICGHQRYVDYTPNQYGANEHEVLMWFKDESARNAMRDRISTKLVYVNHPRAVMGYVEEVAKDQFRRSQKGFHKAWVHFQFDPARLGWFEYSHGDQFENWISGPYLRSQSPAAPMKISQLSEEVLKEFFNLRLQRVNFATDPMVQPVEHAQCSSWQGRYVDTNGDVQDFEDVPEPPSS